MQSGHPNISVVVSVLNDDIHLKRCLNSLISQETGGVEIILVDGGSVDYSVDIANEYVSRYPGIVSLNIDSGRYNSPGYGLSLAHGEYVAFISSSGFVSPGALEMMYQKARNDDADIVCCGYDRIAETAGDPETVRTTKKYRFYAMHHSGRSVMEQPSLLIECSCNVWNKLFRRSFLRQLPCVENWKTDDNTEVYFALAAANKISLYNRCGYSCISGRTGTLLPEEKDFAAVIPSLRRMVQWFDDNGILPFCSREIAFICFFHLLYEIKNILEQKPVSYIVRYVSEVYSFLNRHAPEWRESKYYLQLIPWSTPGYGCFIHLYRRKTNCACGLVLGKIWRKLKRQLKKLLKMKDQAFGEDDAGSDDVDEKSKYVLPAEIMKDIQALQRDILRTIHSFCLENGLRYYAAEGSLLGAIRHQGFIPWDDDMDLAMPRDDYEKLISLWGDKIISGCCVMSGKTYPNHYLPFIKIVQNQNVKYRSLDRKGSDYYQGLCIDIFPIDATVPYDTMAEVKRIRKIRVVRDMMLYKVKSLKSRARRLNCLVRGTSFRSMPSLQAALKKLCTKDNGGDQLCWVNFGSAYSARYERFPKEWWGEPKTGKFDDAEVLLPQCGENILNTIYGAYEELPPAEKQVCRHGYEVIRKA